MRLTMTDVSRAGLCASGTRRWFEHHGLDFRRFLREGMEAEEILARGDYMAQRVIDLKIKREGRDG